MRRITLAAVLLALGTTNSLAASAANTGPAAVSPGDYVVEPTHTRVQFSVSHMGFTNWFGDFTGVSGSLHLDPRHTDRDTLDIRIPVMSVSTTNTKLDGELRSAAWLDANTFPTIHFVGTTVSRTGPNSAAIRGNLTFHGVTKPVTLAVRFNGSGINPLDKNYTVGFDATATIKRSDFGVTIYLPLIGDLTTLRISAAFEKHN